MKGTDPIVLRHTYLDALIKLSRLDFVKVITGIRRSGKSFLLKMFNDYLHQSGVGDDRIIFVDFELLENQDLTDSSKFVSYIKSRLTSRQKYYLFIDEVQELDDWAKIINSVHAGYNCDIYVTGSNSKVFSGEHLTYLSGRYVKLDMYPLSLSEYLDFKSLPKSAAAEAFREYSAYGAFPAVALVDNPYLAKTINSALFDSIFTRDIILRGKIKDTGNFIKTAKFVFDNIGSQVSANSVANTLKSQGHKISVDAVDNYLTLMENAYLIYNCERFDIRGKERLRTNGKYYVTDLGLRNSLLGTRDGNTGHIIENLVFLELKRRGYEVSVGKLGELEVDFVAQKDGNTEYYQVSLSVMDESVYQRELKPLQSIKDNFPKYLITMDNMNFSKDGVINKNLIEFLLEE